MDASGFAHLGLIRGLTRIVTLAFVRRRTLFRDLGKQNMSPKAQISFVIGVALAFCLLIWCVTFALDQSFIAKRTIEFQER
jgi:hypothetical protein